MPLRPHGCGRNGIARWRIGGKNMAHLQFDKEITALLVIDPYNDLVVKHYHRDKLSRLALEVMWPHAPSAVPTCRHHLPGGSLSALPVERVAGRPGRDATRHGGRAPGWVERWHRTCIRSVQPQRLARRPRRREAFRHPIALDCHNKWFERMGRKLPWSRQTRPYGIKKSKWSVITGRRSRSAALACPMLTPSTVSQSLAR